MPAHSTLAVVHGRMPILHKLAFEFRYRHGLSYLDRCGRTVNRIMEEHPDWILRSDQPSPQNAPLVNLVSSTSVVFGARRFNASLERSQNQEPLELTNVSDFATQVGDVSALVIDSLGLDDFWRIGFRVWFLFPAESKQEAETWLRGLGCFTIGNKLTEAFSKNVEATTIAVVMAGSDYQYRVALSGVERQATIDFGSGSMNVDTKEMDEHGRSALERRKKIAKYQRSPEFPAMIDVDVYQEDPVEIDASKFISAAYDDVVEKLSRLRGHDTND